MSKINIIYRVGSNHYAPLVGPPIIVTLKNDSVTFEIPKIVHSELYVIQLKVSDIIAYYKNHFIYLYVHTIYFHSVLFDFKWKPKSK